MKWKCSLVLCTSLLITSLSACGDGKKTIEWKQEAPLVDGRVVVVERISKQTGRLFPENVSLEYEQTLAFVHPDTQETIRWTLPKGLLPAALDFDGSTAYYLLHAYTVADYNKWGCPNPPWLVYRYERGEWNRVPLEQLPAKITERNLIDMGTAAQRFTTDRYVSAEMLRRYWSSDYYLKKYKLISRDRVNPIARGCFDDVLVKQGRQSEIDYRR